MRVQLETLTPFIIKNGETFSLFDLVEDNGNLYRIDEEFFVTSLDRSAGSLEELDTIFKEFLKVKNNGKRYKEKEYSLLWEKINKFNIKNNGLEHIIFPEIKKNNNFMTRDTFASYAYIIKIEGNKKVYLPYIPGSTIKGAIRRSIFLRWLKINPGEVKKNTNYYKDFNRIMRYISTTDFYPDRETLKLEMRSLERTGRTVLPMITRGTFNGSININYKEMIKDKNIERYKIGIWGRVNGKEEMENSLIEIIRSYCKKLLEVNRDHDQKLYSFINKEHLILAIGFGKGISFSSLFPWKKELSIQLPKARSIRRNYVEQDFPKTNYVTEASLNSRLIEAKIGLMKLKFLKEGSTNE